MAADQKSRPVARTRSSSGATRSSTSRAATVNAAMMDEARDVGLLAGEKSAHVSFRAPPALVEAAKRETGVTSISELGTLALLMLAMPDPVGALMKRTRGRLGRDHTLGD